MMSKSPPSANRELWIILFFIILWGFVAWLFPLSAWGQQYLPAAGVAPPPPASQPVVRTDTTTLAVAVWKGRSSFTGETGVNYVVPKGWGSYGGSGFDCNLNGATITFTSAPGDRLLNFASTSRGFTIRNGFIVLGPPEAKRGFARVGGSFQTFGNLVIVGGSDVFNANGDGSRAITLDHVWQQGSYRGNWFYNGDDQPACVHEGWVFKHVYVRDPIREDLGGIAHVLRLYCLKDFYASDCVFDNPQATSGQGAGIRIHSTKGGFQTLERCTIGGYENRVGPLLLHPDVASDRREVRNVTFRNCSLVNRWHITNNTFALLFDHCLFDAGNTIPIGANDPGNYYTDSNGNKRWDKDEPVSTPWPEIKLDGCEVRSTAQSGRLIDASAPAQVTILGSRAINPSRHYDGPLKFTVP